MTRQEYTGPKPELYAALAALQDAYNPWRRDGSLSLADRHEHLVAFMQGLEALAEHGDADAVRIHEAFTGTIAYYEGTRADGYVDPSIPMTDAMQRLQADTQRVAEGDSTMWCPECRRRRIVIDTDTDVIRERYGDREYRVLMLNCGHSRGWETGKFYGFTIDGDGMPYL